MYFSKRNAVGVVRLISDVIGDVDLQVSLMEASGAVTASTDETRVGLHDAAARIVAADKLEELAVRRDGEYSGALRGLELSIVLNGKTAGVIALSGAEEKVERYARIAKRMAESLLLDEALSEQTDVELRARTRFLNEWIHGASRASLGELINKGLRLSIDITAPRRLLLFSVIPTERGAEAEKLQRAIDAAEKSIYEAVQRREEGCIVFRSESYLACLHPHTGDERLLAFAEQIKAEAESCGDAELAVGIDSPVGDCRQMGVAFARAEKAIHACLRSPSRRPRLYESLNMEIFESELTDATKLEFVRRIFRGCTAEEITEYAAMLEAYYDCEGSVAKAAERLLIHKNTLQYRLRRLAERTGYDPRSIKFSSLYYNAVHFFRDLGNIL